MFHPRGRPATLAIVLSCVLLGAVSTQSRAERIRIGLEDALQEARQANARIPVAAFDTLMAAAAVDEARGELGPTLGLEGDVHGGTPSKYASGDARLQVVAGLSIYDGGRLRAGLRTARAGRDLSAVRYRVAVADLDLDVRVRYAEILDLEREVELGRQAVDRLDRYVEVIRARKASGAPVAADLLKARVRLDSETADLQDALGRLAGARLEMNDLLGRDLADSLDLAPLAPPAPAPAGAATWESAPDFAASRLAYRVERTRIDAVRAERRPHLDLAVNAGAEPLLGSSDLAPLNTGRAAGAEVTLQMSWPLWDTGAYRGRMRQARLGVAAAAADTEATRRAVRLNWNRARSDLDHLYGQIQNWEHAVPIAEEAYLQAESSYRGGGATALEVLDAFDQWIQTGRNAAQAVFAYREARARAVRWGPR